LNRLDKEKEEEEEEEEEEESSAWMLWTTNTHLGGVQEVNYPPYSEGRQAFRFRCSSHMPTIPETRVTL